MNVNEAVSKAKQSHITYINTLVLFLYSGMLMFDFSRYYDTTQSKLYTYLFFGMRVLFIFICIYKIIYYFKSNSTYSLLSTCLIIGTFCFHFIKAEYNFRYFFSQFTFFFNLSIVIVACYGILFDDILRTYITTIATLLTIRVICTFANILPVIRHKDPVRGYMWDFGFGSHNTIFWYFVFLCLAWMYFSRRKPQKIVHSLCILLLTLFLYHFTHSQVGTIVMIIGCIGYILIDTLINHNSKLSHILLKIFSLVSLTMPILLLLVSILGAVYYNYYINVHGIRKVNTMFNRFRQFSIDLSLHGIHLPWEPNEMSSEIDPHTFNWLIGDVSISQYHDNIIHNLFINYGIIILALFLIALTLCTFSAFINHNYYMLLIICLITVYSTMETPAFLLGWNPFLLLAFSSHSNTINAVLPMNSQIKSTKMLTIANRKTLLLSLGALIIDLFIFSFIYFVYHNTSFALFVFSCFLSLIIMLYNLLR